MKPFRKKGAVKLVTLVASTLTPRHCNKQPLPTSLQSLSLPQMEPKEATGKENMGTKKKNLTFLRPRLYMLERRKTDTVVDSSVSGDHSGTLRRSQSDRTEYNQKLQGNQHRSIILGYCIPSSVVLLLHRQRDHLRQRRKIEHYLL